jgi:aspartyl-tRNA(Asn)/glutamyl-tRNA(Gln) amidotransferase subunit A
MQQLPTIGEAIQQIADGRLTPLELVEHCLSRIRQFDDRVRAWVLVDQEGALREAQRLTELAKKKRLVGPLHGIPIGIKDVIDVAGWPTRAGSPLRANAPPAEKDAPIVAKLRKAGAIILGKTVTTEWACFDPPPTRNPWNLNHTPGGSSSGSAAAVAMEMCMAALGTQTGGSIIRPAAYCGVCGLKPTFGVFDMEGIVPVSFHLDHVGPLARSVGDLFAVFSAFAIRAHSWSYMEDFPRWRLCLLRPFFLMEAEEQVQRVFEPLWRRLSATAPCSPDADLPASFAEVHANHWRIMAVDAAAYHRRTYESSPQAYGPKVRSLLESGRATSALDYSAALQHRIRFQDEMRALFMPDLQRSAEGQENFDIKYLVMPATTTTAQGAESTGDPRFNSPWSYAGLPAITVPCGLSDTGLPVGLQLVGCDGSDIGLLKVAAWCEQQIGFSSRPPLLHEAY